MGRGAKIAVAVVVGIPIIAIGIAAFFVARESGITSRSYDFPEVTIRARVLPDGTLALHERRTFDFRGGPYSFAFFTIEPTHAPPANIEGFRVEENGRVIPHEASVEDGGFRAQWFFRARDEARTFDISYRVRCAVDVYDDGAHLLWQFVGTGWTEPTDEVRVTVHVPDRSLRPPRRAATCPAPDPGRGYQGRPLAPGELRAWGHGPLAGRVDIPDPQTVVFTVSDLRPEQFVEGSILFPAESVPVAVLLPGGPGRRQVLAEEERLARETNALRAQHDRETALVKVLFVLVPAIMAGLVIAARRRDRNPAIPHHLQEPPDDTHPAELALYWGATRKRLQPRAAYRAQYLHMATAGYLEMEAVGSVSDPSDVRLVLRREPETEVDRRFARFLFGGAADPVSLSKVKARGPRKQLLQTWWETLARQAKPTMEKIAKGRNRAEGTLIALVAVGTGLYGYWRSMGFDEGSFGFRGLVGPLALALLPVAAVSWLVAVRFLPPRLPVRLRARMARWAAFRRFLREFATLQDAPSLAVVVWEQYLVYATALGVADRVERQVRALLPPERLPEPWPGAPQGAEGVSFYRSYGSTPSYAAAGAAAAVGWSSGWGSSSSGGGGGGGFSGGGGGGGGGTGGGAG